ncbi:PAS domain S-box protein [Belnapia sp. T6]|uniref:histidine kinase n=1 Tax=Belnapia mucosa TaxID=2804532 RepID=A0ABS1V517_9PROT|nr:PAS domain S-box protein [Belnapia mucosa]MBL6456216.1 PAS domain S-box protein [Belnapia mucosa]
MVASTTRPVPPLHRAVAWLLVAALTLPAAVLAVGAWLAWEATWREARIELSREADAAAEYAARLVLGYGMAMRRMEDLLRSPAAAAIGADPAGLHGALEVLVAELPQTAAAYVLASDGALQLAARDSMPSAELLAAMQAAAAAELRPGQVRLSRIGGQLLFAAGRRDASDPQVFLSIDPEALGQGLQRVLAAPGDGVRLIGADGSLLARSGGSLGRLPASNHFYGVVANGLDQAVLEDRAPGGVARLMALRRIEEFPGYAASIRPRAAIIAAWRQAVLPQAAIGLPALLAMLALALLVRQSQRRLLTANDGLEARVAERTAELAELSEALELTPCMITDLDGHITHWSEGCVRLYGYSREEAQGRQAAELLETEFCGSSREELHLMLRRDGQWQGELRQRRRDGSMIIASAFWTLRCDPRTGEPRSIVSTRTDLSALRQAERALRRSEARLRRAQEASGAVAFELTEDGTVLADPALAALFGLPSNLELTRPLLAARVHPDDRRAAEAAYRQLGRQGGAFSIETRVVRPDGTERWLLVRGEGVAPPGGGRAPRLVTGIVLDVTQRRAAEAALAESGERLRLAQEAAGFGIYDHDFRTGAVTWDARMRAFWALPDGESVTGRSFLGGLHPEDRPLRRAAMRLAMDPEGPGTYQVEFRVLGLTDGQERWLSTTGQVSFSHGRPVRLTGLAMDITARKRGEQRNELLMREVDHRAKNALAVVQAALRLSRAESPAELVRIIEGRVAALARAQTILAKRRWEGAELHALLEGELAPFLTGLRRDAPRAELIGPPVTVAAHAAQPLSMAVHELATNAMKYGALAHPGGLLQVSWRLDQANRVLVLVWRERGAPELGPVPARRGFGSRVIEQTVQGQLGGTLNRRWLPGGLLCEITVPLSRREGGAGPMLDGEVPPSAAAA